METDRSKKEIENMLIGELPELVETRMGQDVLKIGEERGLVEAVVTLLEAKRGRLGWHHHMTLSLLALWFLVLERQRVGEKNTGDHGVAGAVDLQPPAPATSADGRKNRRESHQRSAA